MKLFLTNSSGTSIRRNMSLGALAVQQCCHIQLGLKAAWALSCVLLEAVSVRYEIREGLWSTLSRS